MKRFFALVLAIVMSVSLLSGITVSAADADLVKMPLVVDSTNGSMESTYPAVNSIDGDADTYFSTEGSGKYVIYDLGRNYPISQVKFSLYATSANAIRFAISKEKPGSSNLTTSTTFDTWRSNADNNVTTVNEESNFNGTSYKDKDFTYLDGEEPVGRYITLYKYYSGTLYLSELEVYVKQENILEFMDIRSDIAVSKYSGMTTGNGPERAIDDDESTYYENTAGGSGYVVYDLGATYKISGIDFLQSREKNAISIALTKNLPASTDLTGHSNIATYCDANGDTILERGTTTISTTVKEHKYAFDAGNEVSARYVIICKPNSGSYKLYDLNVYVTPENSTPSDRAFNIADKAKVSSSFGTGATNAIDGNSETYARMPGNDEYLTIDLGAVYPIKKVEVKLSNSNGNSSTAVVLSQTPPSGDTLTDSSEFDAWYASQTLVARSTFSTDVNEYGYAIDDTTVNARYLTIFQYYSGNVDVYEIGVYVPYNSYMNAVSSVNVAKDKECFSLYEPNSSESIYVRPNVYWRAVDGDESTFAVSRTWGNNTASKAPRFVVDLGAEYKLGDIVLKPYNGGTTNIYVTNSNNFATANLFTVATGVVTSSNVKQTYTTYIDKNADDAVKNLSETGWRYIVIDRVATGGGQMYGISEIEANASISNADVDKATEYVRAYRISGKRDAYATGNVSGDLNEICDGIYLYSNSSEARVGATSGKRNYLYYDLGDSYNISYAVVIPHNGYSGLNYGFDIVGANSIDDFTNDTCDTLATVSEYNQAGTTIQDADIWKVDTLPAYANKKYRYVGVRGQSGCQINLAELEIFAKGINFEQALGNVNATISALDEDGSLNDVVVSSDGATTANGASTYRVIVASYNDEDEMLYADYSDIVLTDFARSAESFTVEIKDIVPDEASYIKAIVVDNFDNITPIMDDAVKTLIEK